MRSPPAGAVVILCLSIAGLLSAQDAAGPSGLQELFDLSVQRKKLAFERDVIEKRLAAIDRRLAELEAVQFAAFERVADPTGSDYFESLSDTVLFATATRDISQGELLLYHAPGIYRVRESKPTLTTKGECWYFRPDRDVRQGQQMTIALVYDAPEELALQAQGYFPLTSRARDPEQAYDTRIEVRN